MERLQMLREAERLAHEHVDLYSALSDQNHKILQQFPTDRAAIQELAYTILSQAAELAEP